MEEYVDERTVRIGTAAFCGGCVTMLALLIAAPDLAFGLRLAIALGGVAAGALIAYIAYDVREVLTAIPRAARAAIPAVVTALAAIAAVPGATLAAFREWTGKPRGLFYLSMLLGLGTTFGIVMTSDPAMRAADFDAVLICMCMAFPMGLVFAGGAGMILAWRVQTSVWWRKRSDDLGYLDIPDDLNLCVGFTPFSAIPPRDAFRFYGDALVNVLLGVLWLVRAIVWYIPLGLAAFVAALYVRIHRAERMIAMVDAPLGALLAYSALRIAHGTALTAMPIAMQLGMVALGGATAALLGMIVNYEIVAKRVLRTITNERR